MDENIDSQESVPAMSEPGASNTSDAPLFDSRVLQMMKNMGYKPGTGLGKEEQGIVQPISVSTHLGVRGLGLQVPNLGYSTDQWDFSMEKLVVEEQVNWLYNPNKPHYTTVSEEWMVERPENLNVATNSTFCDPDVQTDVFKAKEIFDELDAKELNLARARANPFETVRSVFFMNRAALKMANIDAACGFMFTQIDNQGHQPVYFADVCAGPGGFTEYILWRKKWLYKGFGMTLKDEHDFTLSESSCASSATFQCLYGADGTGNVCNPSNLTDFSGRVGHETGQGVHFMMSDGGFCVDGQEHLQEVLSKNIYVCQCYLALAILRPQGHFVTKLFDVFTPFSAGLLFLMYLCFEKVGIIKPNSSRPANSERYLVCNNYHVNETTQAVKEYLRKVVDKLWELREEKERDIVEIVPQDILLNDKDFFGYIHESNTSIGKRQIIALRKLAQFCRNPTLVEHRQASMREECLKYWKIPDRKRNTSLKPCKINALLSKNGIDKGALTAPYTLLSPNEFNVLHTVINKVDDWRFMLLLTTKKDRKLQYYAGLGAGKSFRFLNGKWSKISHLNLVKGTLLFGEFVEEICTYHSGYEGFEKRYSLHVVDANRLGDMDLRNYTYLERLKFIEMYCKSVSRESQSEYSVRLRSKPIQSLSDLLLNRTVADVGPVKLPLQGYRAVSEQFDVKSISMFDSMEKTFFNTGNKLFVVHNVDWPKLKPTLENIVT